MQRRSFVVLGGAAAACIAAGIQAGVVSVAAAPGTTRAHPDSNAIVRVDSQTVTRRSGNSSATITQSGKGESTASITQDGRTTTLRSGALTRRDDGHAQKCADLEGDEHAIENDVIAGRVPCEDDRRARQDRRKDRPATARGPDAGTLVDGMRRDAIRRLEDQSGLDLKDFFGR